MKNLSSFVRNTVYQIENECIYFLMIFSDYFHRSGFVDIFGLCELFSLVEKYRFNINFFVKLHLKYNSPFRIL